MNTRESLSLEKYETKAQPSAHLLGKCFSLFVIQLKQLSPSQLFFRLEIRYTLDVYSLYAFANEHMHAVYSITL